MGGRGKEKGEKDGKGRKLSSARKSERKGAENY